MIIFWLTTIQLLGYLLTYKAKNKSSGVLCCGLFGFSGSNAAEITKLRWLAVLNESRGRSSTGIYTLKGDKRATKALEKDIVTATKFIVSEEYNKAVAGAVMAIGHTRAATSGGVTIPNAHPFEYNFGLRTIGAHNGFIADALLARYLKEYDLEEHFNINTMCDSQLIFAMLSKFNGDFRKLSEIEGGINTLFTFPDKNPNLLFAYKRAARTLHYGQTPEGIYLSSEDEPLEQIGCYNITALDDDSVTIFKDGAVLDIQPIAPPKWHLPLGTNNNNYQQKLNFKEKSEYEETKNISTTGMVPYNYKAYKGRKWDTKFGKYVGGAEDEETPQECSVIINRNNRESSKNSVDDKFKMIIKDAIKEVAFITDEPTRLAASEAIDYQLDDLTDCLVVVNLIDSVHEEPLPGWCVMDREDPTDIAAISGPNGIAILRYPYSKTKVDTARILHIYDPVDGTSFFTMEVKPKMMRILEVVLQIPFSQTESSKTSSDADKVLLGGTAERNARLGADQNDKVIPANAEQVSLSGSEGEDRKTIQGKKVSIYSRDKEKETDGVKGSEGHKEFMAKRIERLRKERSLAYTDSWLNQELRELARIRKADQWAQFEPSVVMVRATRPYRELRGAFSIQLERFIDLEDLLLDACLLHVNANKRHKWTDAVGYYAVVLLTECIEDYWTPEFVHNAGEKGLVDIDYKVVDDFTTVYYDDLKIRMHKKTLEDPTDKPVMRLATSKSIEEETPVNTEALNDLTAEDLYI